MLLREFPELYITADFSHWCNVCESLLDDQKAHLDLAISRAIHIHGRVGLRSGPQVPDPGAPEYAEELRVHLGWWTDIARGRREEGMPVLSSIRNSVRPGTCRRCRIRNSRSRICGKSGCG